MKVVINGSTYTQFDSLGFNPETDLMNNSLPINQFEARLFTNDAINYGQWAELKDDNNNLWCKYWLSYAERIGRDDERNTYIVKIIGQSPLAFCERVKMPAKFYSSSTAKAAISEVLSYVGSLGTISNVVPDSSILATLETIDVTGFAPEQTARERLQWILLLTGSYVTSYFGSYINIEDIDTSGGTLIPFEYTYWKPVISHRDYVTKIIVHAYSFTSGEPSSTDKYVTDGTNYWIQTETVVTLSNSSVPSGAPENEVEIEGCTLISQTNVSTVATNLAAYYFNRAEVDLDMINNAEYKPGDRIIAYLDEDSLVAGYIDRCDFTFGLQAKANLHLTAAETVDGAALIIQYKWGDIVVAMRRFYLPKNHAYSITTEYIDAFISNHRYVFRPLTATISGTLTQNTTETVNVEVALEWYAEDTNDRAAINTQEQEVLVLIDAMYNNLMQYKHNENVRNVLAMIHAKWRSNCTSMFSKMRQEADTTAYNLRILSVDEVDMDENYTVEIS